MSIRLLEKISIAGVDYAVGATVTGTADWEAAQVNANRAVWVTRTQAPGEGLVPAEFATDASGNVTGLMGPDGGYMYAVVTVQPSGDTTGATDALAINAALSANTHVKLISGDYYINDTLDLVGRFIDPDYLQQAQTLEGNGIGQTRITMVTAGIPAIQKNAGISCNISGFSLYGPGVADVDSVGYMAETVGGGNYLRDVYIDQFATAVRLYDDTLTELTNVQMRACNYGVQFGYNTDIITFYSCRIQEMLVAGIESGWTDATHGPGAGTNNDNITFIGCRFGKNAVSADLHDYNSTCITFLNCYFEDEYKIAWLGSAADTTTAPKKVVFDLCHIEYSVVTPAEDLIEYRNPFTAISDITIRKSHCQDALPSGIVYLTCGINTAIDWSENIMPYTSGQIRYYTGAAQSYYISGLGISSKQTTRMLSCTQQLMYADASVLAKAQLSCQITNGTNQTLAEFKRLASNTGAVAGEIANVVDVDGKWVVYKGVHQLISPAAALPTAASTYRGCMAYQSGGAGVADTVKCCMKSSADTYSWVTVSTG